MHKIFYLFLLALLLAACAAQPAGPAATTAPVAPAPTVAAAPTTAAPAPTAAPAAARPTVQAPTPFVAAPNTPAQPLAEGWWTDAVCYEIFVRSFYDSDGNGIGDFNGIVQKLDYINDGKPDTTTDLGATCLWLMPINPATSYHGYDVTDYYAVNPDFGTTEDFKRLIAEADKRGVKVIIDLVLNHTSVEHPWFKQALADPASPYRDWFIFSPTDPGYKGPWGDAAWHKTAAGNEWYYGIFWSGMPDLNYNNPAVTAEAQKISAFWRNDMGVAGFRLDAIKHLIEDGQIQENTPATHAWLRGYRTFLEQAAPGTFTVGEIYDGNPVTLAPYYPDQLDSYFEFGTSAGIIQSAITGRAGPFRVAAQTAIDKLPFMRFAPFLANHDQPRAMTQLGEDVGKAKVAAAALLMAPGLPFLYYGEEIGITGAKPDPNLRTPMQWDATANAGFTNGTPWSAPQANYTSINVAAQTADSASLLSEYRRLISTRRASQALSRGDMFTLTSSVREVAAFLRRSEGQTVLVLINFGRQPAEGVTLAAPAGTFAPGELFAQPLYAQGPAATANVAADGSLADYIPVPTMEPQSVLVFELLKQ